MSTLDRGGVMLGYEEAGNGSPPLVFVHGLACHRGFWPRQVEYFSRSHRVLAVDLRGHGESGAPEQRYTMQALADDVAWMCSRLAVERPVVIGHSLGGLVALELSAGYPDQLSAAALVDSVLLPGGDRTEFVRALVAGLRAPGGWDRLREYYTSFFGPYDDSARKSWILDQTRVTPAHVTSSILEESIRSWDDADALLRCRVPLLYLDAGTPNANLEHAARLRPELIVGRTIGSGHFSQCEVPEQVNAALGRFLQIALAQRPPSQRPAWFPR